MLWVIGPGSLMHVPLLKRIVLARICLNHARWPRLHSFGGPIAKQMALGFYVYTW